MKSTILAVFVAAVLAPLASVPAAAQYHPEGYKPHDYQGPPPGDRYNPKYDDGKYRPGHWQHYRNYDWDRPGKGGQYYADDYQRSGRYYKERRLGANDRIYRGRDGRYYCRRNDGTTGLIIGGLAGGVLGNVIANGHSSTLATLLGAGGGALVGRSIDRNNVRCR